MTRGNGIARRPALACWMVSPDPQVMTRATASPGAGSGSSTGSNGSFAPRSSIAFMRLHPLPRPDYGAGCRYCNFTRGEYRMSRTIPIRMGGYGPATTSFSRGLKLIGDRLTAAFGDEVDVKYVWNIMDLGYRAEDILWLVEHGLLTLGYQSSSYLTDRVPELG